ncbi:hypothetical protein GUITHDRAFT_117839 [Guillardia theta CCMP2712]|uniref:Uncharacterized protein n=1 Tax=Guillardia theta (strain CCMP2712) TaxID=905079 RepID=L1IJR5_GUITC|nr:hypothetical protein GUITHDRAFT_117839 [Guillardia theta CCMP2712]EKX36050.1 hypothetical protein GUITHDRAFT_117839 [Guillardia theta CCMP2712]|eukprot:XP_005823030.1 hypothetical protein GUITHDRAFT_117839 [Guillardia theta CCMP2712]
MSNPCGEVWDEITQQDVPKVDTKSFGLLCFILNIFFPGIGSIVAGLKGDKTSTMIVGVLQFVTSWFILGWIWSICPLSNA